MSTAVITQEMFKNMNFDVQTTSNVKATSVNERSNPSVLIVFSNSDINAAIYHLVKSMENPFDAKAIATILLQESIKEDFIEKVQRQLKPYDEDMIKNHPQFGKALETIKKLNAQVVTSDKAVENSFYPTLVCDFTHEHLGLNPISGFVTLHTFRTAKEAASLVKKESFEFVYTSIWHENHSYAYELVSAIKSQVYFINCHQVPLEILEEPKAERRNFVGLHKSYHYETFEHGGLQKSIVFPVGSIFAN